MIYCEKGGIMPKGVLTPEMEAKKFREGNPGGPGRPKKLVNRGISNEIVALIREEVGEVIARDLGSTEEMWSVIIQRAFVDEDSRGRRGSYQWAKLLLAYLYGQPPAKVEVESTNTVDKMRLLFEMANAEKENVKTVDSDAEYVD
jgi:hypothetical protein